MDSHQPAVLGNAVERISAQIGAADTSDVADLFERIIQSLYAKVVRAGDTVIDAGAHVGRHTIPLARLVGSDGVVVAFEPLPAAAAKLRQLLAQSGLGQRVRLRTEALADERGSRPFFAVNNMPEYSGLRSRQYVGFVPDHTEIQVNVETIDAVLRTNICAGPLSFVKLDLEGEEFSALRGAEETLRVRRPCCVFENGLEWSAGNQGAREFLGYFRDLGYDLYDILGCRVDESRWGRPGPWNFVAMPEANSRELLPLVWASALEELLASHWSPAGLLGPPPTSFPSRAGFGGAGVTGHVDRIESSTRVSGWAGDLQSGRPAASLVLTVDGAALATFFPARHRHDVAAETGQVDFARSGFDITFRTPAVHRVEVYAEAADGTFVQLAGAKPSLATVETDGHDQQRAASDHDDWQRLAEERQEALEKQLAIVAAFQQNQPELETDRDNWQRLALERQEALERQLALVADFQQNQPQLETDRDNWQRLAKEREATVERQSAAIERLTLDRDNWHRKAAEVNATIATLRKGLWIRVGLRLGLVDTFEPKG